MNTNDTHSILMASELSRKMVSSCKQTLVAQVELRVR